ncbi:tetratricopeptide repeat protein [Hypnocyclicus thermotrophus]|uniref:Tetratricopeptide repeat protein n=1 Tax=Hypnocyclicus thermotrophus TaxID=1627895 RepID=A0AA46I6G0_9FUSO|nr:tetratricopeptide repeat protein [Hypnocyclicus thermotrophus]TDT71741.1 tetratricopeptide repeat protein [Hypnocyclicus thermotrophus]
MYQKIFNALGEEYLEIKKLFLNKELILAYEKLNEYEKTKKNKNYIYFLKALIWIIQKKNKKSLEYFEKIKYEDIKLLIGKDEYLEILGTIYLEEKKYLEAAKYLQEALTINKTNINAKFNLGIIYIHLKDYKNAYKTFLELEKYNIKNNELKESIKKNIITLEKVMN